MSNEIEMSPLGSQITQKPFSVAPKEGPLASRNITRKDSHAEPPQIGKLLDEILNKPEIKKSIEEGQKKAKKYQELQQKSNALPEKKRTEKSDKPFDTTIPTSEEEFSNQIKSQNLTEAEKQNAIIQWGVALKQKLQKDISEYFTARKESLPKTLEKLLTEIRDKFEPLWPKTNLLPSFENTVQALWNEQKEAVSRYWEENSKGIEQLGTLCEKTLIEFRREHPKGTKEEYIQAVEAKILSSPDIYGKTLSQRESFELPATNIWNYYSKHPLPQ